MRGWIFDRADGGLDRVGEHHDPGFLGTRLRSRITVILLLDFIDLGLIGVVARQVHRLGVEEVHARCPVVHGDEIDHFFRQVVITCQGHAVLDMRGNNERTHAGSELVVTVPAPLLVFHEIGRFHHFPDVMKICAHPAEDLVGTHGGGGGLRQARQRHAVVVRPRGLFRQLAQEGMVEMHQLHQRKVGGDAKRFLEKYKEPVCQNGGDGSVDQTVGELFGDNGE